MNHYQAIYIEILHDYSAVLERFFAKAYELLDSICFIELYQEQLDVGFFTRVIRNNIGHDFLFRKFPWSISNQRTFQFCVHQGIHFTSSQLNVSPVLK